MNGNNSLTQLEFQCGPINTIAEMFADPQVQARDMIVEMEHPVIDNLKLTGSPLKLSKTPVTMRKHPPLHGEHTTSVLLEMGYSEEEINHLKNIQISLGENGCFEEVTVR